jgi:hypothetical protein
MVYAFAILNNNNLPLQGLFNSVVYLFPRYQNINENVNSLLQTVARAQLKRQKHQNDVQGGTLSEQVALLNRRRSQKRDVKNDVIDHNIPRYPLRISSNTNLQNHDPFHPISSATSNEISTSHHHEHIKPRNSLRATVTFKNDLICVGLKEICCVSN